MPYAPITRPLCSKIVYCSFESQSEKQFDIEEEQNKLLRAEARQKKTLSAAATKRRELEIIHLHTTGMSQSKIATTLKCSRYLVRYYLTPEEKRNAARRK
jgi:DNA-binding NarL/FixJ family response regulator